MNYFYQLLFCYAVFASFFAFVSWYFTKCVNKQSRAFENRGSVQLVRTCSINVPPRSGISRHAQFNFYIFN